LGYSQKDKNAEDTGKMRTLSGFALILQKKSGILYIIYMNKKLFKAAL